MSSPWAVPSVRRTGLVAGLTVAPLAAAFRFAHVYRVRAGFPRRRPPRFSPTDLGLPFAETTISSDSGELPAWFIPARGGAPGPAVLARPWLGLGSRSDPADRPVPERRRVPLPDLRRPRQRGESRRGPAGQRRRVRRRRDGRLRRARRSAGGDAGAIFGHSMGGVGAILAAPRTRASPRSSASRRRPIPAGWSARPSGWPDSPSPDRSPRRSPGSRAGSSSGRAVTPSGDQRPACASHGIEVRVLIAHGRDDEVMPIEHARRIARAALAPRRGRADAAPVQLLIVETGGHSWSYEDETYRRTVAAFLARALGGPLSPGPPRTPRLQPTRGACPRSRRRSSAIEPPRRRWRWSVGRPAQEP